MRRRFTITLEEENMKQMHAFAKALGLGPGWVSQMLDEFMSDFLKKVAPTLYEAKQKGKISMQQMLSMVGSELDKINEEVTSAKPTPKTTAVEKRNRGKN